MPDGGTIRVIGEIMVDVIAHASAQTTTGSDTPARIADADGGSAANVAAWLAQLGTPTELIACVGDDACGHAALSRLAAAGVALRVRVDPLRPTGRCIVIVTPDAERTMYPDPGANASLAPTDIDATAWRASDHLHASGYSLLREGPRAAALRALDAARERSLTVSIDASSEAPLRALGAPAFLSWLRPGDVLFANEAEARALTGEQDPTRSASALASHGLVAVVKRGAAGAVARCGDATWQVPAQPAAVTDTTGAGDAFAAGFLASWTRDGDLAIALERATREAARAVSHPGGRP